MYVLCSLYFAFTKAKISLVSRSFGEASFLKENLVVFTEMPFLILTVYSS